MKDFKTLQKKAEFHYLRGDYKEAKRIYEQMLFLTRKNTLKRNRVKECILDCDIKMNLYDAISETDIIKLRDNLNEIL